MLVMGARRVIGRIMYLARGWRAVLVVTALLAAGWPLPAQSTDSMKIELAPVLFNWEPAIAIS